MSTTTFHFEPFEASLAFSDLGPYRAADYWQLPEGAPVELIQGRLVVSPSPNVLHQIIIATLLERWHACSRKSKSRVILSPMDVILSDDTILQPDLLYISKSRRHIIHERIQGAPDLIVEIISGSPRKDRVVKLDLYAKYGVSEYWIVDPQTKHIEFLLNENGRFVVHSATNDRYQSPRHPEVEIDLTEFWREVDLQMSDD
jgi:Uma2 family endonuclease